MSLSKPVPLTDKLVYFVDAFVYVYDEHFIAYIDKLQYRMDKSGKAAGNVSKYAEGLKGGTEIFEGVSKALSALGLSAISQIAIAIGKRNNRNNLKKLMSYLDLYKQGKEGVQETLKRAAVEISICYQKQIESVAENDSWQRALEKLGEDAVKRSVEYFRNNPKEQFSVESLTKSVVHGKSPKYANTAFKFIPSFTSGHHVKMDGEKVTTPEVFDEVDAVQLKDDGTSSIAWKNKGEEAKCGSRLAFDWEKSDQNRKFEVSQQIEKFMLHLGDSDKLLETYEEKKNPESIAEKIEDALKDMKDEADQGTKLVVQEIASIDEKNLKGIIEDAKNALQATQIQIFEGQVNINEAIVAGIHATSGATGTISQNQTFKKDVIVGAGSKGTVLGMKLGD